MSARAGGRGRGDDIGPRLKRLILSSKPPTAVSLWNALNATEREAAVRAHVGADHQGRRQLESIVAEARHLRPATVRKWTVEKIVAAMKVVSLRDPGLALGLIQSHHIPGQLPMVKGFLSALGVAHDEGIVGSIDDVDASEEVVRSASGAIADEYGDRAAAVYLLALLHWRAPAGKKARESCVISSTV